MFFNELGKDRKPTLAPCVFSWPSPVSLCSMNATAFYFVNAMADENTEIALGLKRRDPDLLDHLIEKYQHRLLRYLVSLTTWLFTIARNLVIDHMRRKQPTSLEALSANDDAAPFEIPVTGQPTAFDVTVQREQNEQISAGMEQIVPEYREALVLRFQEGMSLDEIAQVTGAPLGTVKSRIYRGLSALEPWVKGARL